MAGSGDWAGLTAIEVAAQRRRQGLGRAVTMALAARAAARGATGLYLQVADDNHGARALYRQLGFADHHGYHYRIAPDSLTQAQLARRRRTPRGRPPAEHDGAGA